MGGLFGAKQVKTPSAADVEAQQAAADAQAQADELAKIKQQQSALSATQGTTQGGGDAPNSLRAQLLGTA